MTIKNKHLMPNERYVMIRTLGNKLAIIKSMGQHEMLVTTDIMQEILEMLKEQEPVKPVDQGDDSYVCDNCGEIVGWEEMACCGIDQVKFKYCPMCGKAVKWDGLER